MLLFSTQKVCLCAIFSRVRRAAYLYDFFFVISCMEKHSTYLFPHMGCSRDFGVSLLFKQTFSSRKMAITNSYYGRERPYTVFSVMAFLTQITLCRLWQKRVGIVTNAAAWILFSGVLSKWGIFIKMRAALLAPILLSVMKKGESKEGNSHFDETLSIC